MRRKYFIRGLGLGIIITAVIFIIAMMFNQGTMSDAQIIAKAKELGMIMPDNTMNESKTDSNSTPKTELDKLQESLDGEGENTDGKEPENADEAGNENETEPESVLNQGTTTTENLTGNEVTPPPASANTTSPQAEANKAEQEIKDAQNSSTTVTNGTTVNSSNIVKFQIKSGENSGKVAENLKKAGLITDARAFDTYLEQNGYDMSLRVGTFEIRTGSTNEVIAKTLTGR